MSSKQYNAMHRIKMEEKEKQQKCIFKIRRFITESFLGKYICPCLKIKDLEEKKWSQMNKLEKKYRIKRLWIKARLVYHFIKLKETTAEAKRIKRVDGKGDDDVDVDLEYFNSTQETVWKWYIIRQENTLP